MKLPKFLSPKVKGPLSGLTFKNRLKNMENNFYFILKVFFVLEIILSLFFGYVEKWVDKEPKVNFKIYDINN